MSMESSTGRSLFTIYNWITKNVNKTTDYVGILGRKTDVIFIIIFKTNNEIDTIQHLIITE